MTNFETSKARAFAADFADAVDNLCSSAGGELTMQELNEEGTVSWKEIFNRMDAEEIEVLMERLVTAHGEYNDFYYHDLHDVCPGVPVDVAPAKVLTKADTDSVDAIEWPEEVKVDAIEEPDEAELDNSHF